MSAAGLHGPLSLLSATDVCELRLSMYCVIIECLITTTVTYCSSTTARTAGRKPCLKVGDGVKVCIGPPVLSYPISTNGEKLRFHAAKINKN